MKTISMRFDCKHISSEVHHVFVLMSFNKIIYFDRRCSFLYAFYLIWFTFPCLMFFMLESCVKLEVAMIISDCYEWIAYDISDG